MSPPVLAFQRVGCYARAEVHVLWFLHLAAAADLDGDGYAPPADCDDTRADVNPGHAEVCWEELGVDDDCDGRVDDADPSVRALPYWHEDLDGDGVAGLLVTRACVGPPGTIRPHGAALDCDDQDPAAASAVAVWFPDADGDGIPGGSGWVQQCHAPPGYLPDPLYSDCEDADPAIYPGAVDVCDDGIDQDCADGDRVCQWWDHTVSGIGTTNGFGSTVTVVEDGTGDGIADLWVTGAATAEVWLIPGPFDQDLDQADAFATLTSDAANFDWLDALASPGDVDGDGVAEVVLGAAGTRVGIVDRAGAVYAVRGGAAGTRAVDRAAWTTYQGSGFGSLGSAVATGDWDGGLPEVFATAPNLAANGSNSGAVYVTSRYPRGTVSMPAVAEAVIEGTAASEYLGAPGMLVVDTDQDGFDDLLVGGQGAVDSYVFRSPPTGTVPASAADVSLVAPAGWTGVVPMGVVDVDGDGGVELALAVGSSNDGQLWFVPGDTDGVDLSGTAVAKLVTASTDTPRHFATGDLDGDGFDDLAIGFAESGTNDRNGVWLFAGPLTGTLDAAMADVELVGPHDDDDATHAELADLDGDGVLDLVVGSPRWFYREPSVEGLVYVLGGPLL